MFSVETPTRSELNGESTLSFGETRDLASEMRGENSWATLLNSVLTGCEMVSDMVTVNDIACDQTVHECVLLCEGKQERLWASCGYILEDH